MKINKEYLWGKIKAIAMCLSVSIIVTLLVFSSANFFYYGCLTPFFSFDDKQTNYGDGCLEDYCVCTDREDCSYQKTVYVCIFFFSMLSLMLISYSWIDESF